MMTAEEDTYMNAVQLMKPLDLTTADYAAFSITMDNAMKKGLQRECSGKTSIKMYPSYVNKIPNGSEKGHFLAIDLGGTNYRILLVHLAGNKSTPKLEERAYAIPHTIMTGSGKELFDFIAKSLYDFLRSHELIDVEIELGFTFSFPCQQHGLNNATLVRWTKGFTAEDVVGENVSELLQSAIYRTGSKVKVVAVVNDTVGTLASCALQDSKCAIGLIIGTGTNAAYIENSELVETLESECGPHVVINTEWGAFGEFGEIDSIRTCFDKAVDAESVNPGCQLFEKMISGMYLGEIVRHILMSMVEQKLLFQGEMPEKLGIKGIIETKFLSEVERDPPHRHYCTHYVLTEDLAVPIVEPVDSQIVRYVCEVVCKRAAYLVGAGIACLLRRLNRPEVTVGIDGSLYKFHPKFHERMTDIIDKLKPSNASFRLRLSEDGSGKGAAAIAAASMQSRSPVGASSNP